MRDCAHQRAPWQGTSTGRPLIWRGRIAIPPLLENYSCPRLRLDCCGAAERGAKDIITNWQRVEAPDGCPWLWSPRFQLKTVEQAQNVFFSPECPKEVVQAWLRESKSPYESAREGLSVLRPFGAAEGVLSALDGLPETGRRFYVLAGNEICLSRLR